MTYSNFNEQPPRKILITGGAGFIGGTLIRKLIANTNHEIINLDKLGYASDLSSINEYLEKSNNKHRYKFYKVDLTNKSVLEQIINCESPDIVFHLAAESHVDRSLTNPSNFIESNIVGTFNLLESCKNLHNNLSRRAKDKFRLIHVSTDEVFGSLNTSEKFKETTPYNPRSPYSASKAASDHLARAWYYSFKLPVIITNCSNNYGPYQFPEKLIPLSIIKALNHDKIPLYGQGDNIRDWLFVEDHVDALILISEKGNSGETYCIGSNNEKSNKSIMEKICLTLDKLKPAEIEYSSLIELVQDRPGHDKRYAIDPTKLKNELNWEPKHSFDEGLLKTIQWYINNLSWCNKVMKDSGYSGERLGNFF